jgi:hypothetical protein
MGKEQKDGGQQKSGNGSSIPKADLTPGRQVPPQGGLAATSLVFAHTPLGTYLLHKAMAQDLKKERQVDLSKMESILQEFLGAFILLGYDMANDPVTLVYAPDQKNADALAAQLNRYFYKCQNTIQPKNNEGGLASWSQ